MQWGQGGAGLGLGCSQGRLLEEAPRVGPRNAGPGLRPGLLSFLAQIGPGPQREWP